MLGELCLALVIYHESRGEPLRGKQAVADVVINRTISEDYPEHICDVIKEKNQFSFVSKNGWVLIPDDSESWIVATKISQQAMKKSFFNDKNMLWFHQKDLSRKWTKSLRKKMVVGNHVFWTKVNNNPNNLIRPKSRPKNLK
tara:strand:- start:15428 stop:15853 length:426 start_codon:yes stop_codon:yes gene_type:complete